MIHVERLPKTAQGLKCFLDLPYRLYHGDRNWVPPLYDDTRRMLLGENNPLLTGEHEFFVAYDDDRITGRVLAGVDARLNERLNERRGYLSLFECESNMEYARALLDTACEYLRGLGMTVVVGPNAPTLNDFSKGFLYSGFDGEPTIFNPYNPPYYNEFWAEYGFLKHRDHYAYHLSLDKFPINDFRELEKRARKRFNYTVKLIDLNRVDRHKLSDEAARVISEAFPSDWELVPPTKDDIYNEMNAMQGLASSAVVVMAYSGERPIGIITSFPDFNPLIKRNRGKLFPFGWLTMLLGHGKLIRARCNMLFVTPDFQNRAVDVSMSLCAYEQAVKLGIREVEASTIDETNIRSVLSAERTGAERYRVYRQYILKL